MAEIIHVCDHCGGQFNRLTDAEAHEKVCPKNDAALEGFSERIQNLEIQMDKLRKAVGTEIAAIKKEVHRRQLAIDERVDLAVRQIRKGQR